MLEENILEWRKRDRREGMREVLLRQLERRFGPLSEERRRGIEAITSAARLADQILTAKSLDEMGL
jgi:hypothetical protein